MIRIGFFMTLLALLPALLAQDKPRATKEKKTAASLVTPEREAAVNTFVARQHPELGDLLKQLKESNSRQYEKAVRELYVSSEHLTQLQETDPNRYELELKAWKLHSRLQLLSAKLTMNPSDELKQELKTILGEHYDVRRELLALDRDKLRERMKKVEKDLSDYEARRGAAIKKQFELLTTHNPHPKTKFEKKKESEKSANTTSP